MGTKTNNLKELKPRREQFFDYTLLLVVVFLIMFGLLMIYSTSPYTAVIEGFKPTHYLKKQAIAVAIGLVLMIFMIIVPYTFWRKFYFLGYIISMLLIAAVLFDKYSRTSHGATRWIHIGDYSLQPAEVAKLCVILFLAVMICKMVDNINTAKSSIVLLCMILPICLEIFFFTKNLSSAIIVFGIAFCMVFVANKKYIGFIFATVLAGVCVAVIVIIIVSINANQVGGNLIDFRGLRVLAWLDPEKYVSDSGLQTLQSLYAIGSGGFFGKGLGESMQKLGSLPEAHNDMIFSIICEELGLLGGLAVIILFILLIWRMFIIAQNTSDLFGAMLVVGVMSHFMIQVLINIAVVTNAIPNTGVTLPFISYGGSSILFLMIEVGLVLNVSRGIYVKEGQ